MYGPMPSIDDQSNGTGLSQSTQKVLRIEELMNRYSQYYRNPDGIIRLAIFNSINGDNKLLDQILEQLHGIDSLANVKL